MPILGLKKITRRVSKPASLLKCTLRWSPVHVCYILFDSALPLTNSSAPAMLEHPLSDTGGKVKQELDNATSTAVFLNPFEQWVIQRIREAREDGISAADGLRRLRDRCRIQEIRQADLLRRLGEINVLSKNFE